MSDEIARMQLEVELGQLQQNERSTKLRGLQLAVDVQKNQEALASIQEAVATKQREIDTFGQPVAAETGV